MTETDAYEAIAQHWAAQWPVLHPDIPWVTDNEILDAADSWARITLVPTLSTTAALGAPACMQRIGRIAVQLFAPTGAGPRTLFSMVDEVRRMFEGKAIAVSDGRVNIFAGSPSPPIADGKWFTTTLAIEYRLLDEH